MAKVLCFDCLFQNESLSDLVEETIEDTEEGVICPQVVSYQDFQYQVRQSLDDVLIDNYVYGLRQIIQDFMQCPSLY